MKTILLLLLAFTASAKPNVSHIDYYLLSDRRHTLKITPFQYSLQMYTDVWSNYAYVNKTDIYIPDCKIFVRLTYSPLRDTLYWYNITYPSTYVFVKL